MKIISPLEQSNPLATAMRVDELAQPKMMVLGRCGDSAAWSLYGLLRAARVGGTLTKTPALAEAGGFRYISQGIRQLADVADKLNDKLLAPIENVPLLGAALEAILSRGCYYRC